MPRWWPLRRLRRSNLRRRVTARTSAVDSPPQVPGLSIEATSASRRDRLVIMQNSAAPRTHADNVGEGDLNNSEEQRIATSDFWHTMIRISNTAKERLKGRLLKYRKLIEGVYLALLFLDFVSSFAQLTFMLFRLLALQIWWLMPNIFSRPKHESKNSVGTASTPLRAFCTWLWNCMPGLFTESKPDASFVERHPFLVAPLVLVMISSLLIIVSRSRVGRPAVDALATLAREAVEHRLQHLVQAIYWGLFAVFWLHDACIQYFVHQSHWAWYVRIMLAVPPAAAMALRSGRRFYNLQQAQTERVDQSLGASFALILVSGPLALDAVDNSRVLRSQERLIFLALAGLALTSGIARLGKTLGSQALVALASLPERMVQKGFQNAQEIYVEDWRGLFARQILTPLVFAEYLSTCALVFTFARDIKSAGKEQSLVSLAFQAFYGSSSPFAVRYVHVGAYWLWRMWPLVASVLHGFNKMVAMPLVCYVLKPGLGMLFCSVQLCKTTASRFFEHGVKPMARCILRISRSVAWRTLQILRLLQSICSWVRETIIEPTKREGSRLVVEPTIRCVLFGLKMIKWACGWLADRLVELLIRPTIRCVLFGLKMIKLACGWLADRLVMLLIRPTIRCVLFGLKMIKLACGWLADRLVELLIRPTIRCVLFGLKMIKLACGWLADRLVKLLIRPTLAFLKILLRGFSTAVVWVFRYSSSWWLPLSGIVGASYLARLFAAAFFLASSDERQGQAWSIIGIFVGFWSSLVIGACLLHAFIIRRLRETRHNRGLPLELDTGSVFAKNIHFGAAFVFMPMCLIFFRAGRTVVRSFFDIFGDLADFSFKTIGPLFSNLRKGLEKLLRSLSEPAVIMFKGVYHSPYASFIIAALLVAAIYFIDQYVYLGTRLISAFSGYIQTALAHLHQCALQANSMFETSVRCLFDAGSQVSLAIENSLDNVESPATPGLGYFLWIASSCILACQSPKAKYASILIYFGLIMTLLAPNSKSKYPFWGKVSFLVWSLYWVLALLFGVLDASWRDRARVNQQRSFPSSRERARVNQQRSFPSPKPRPVALQTVKRQESEFDENDCAVCLEELDAIENCSLPCGHQFHGPCVTLWLEHSATCPTCRASTTNFGFLKDNIF